MDALNVLPEHILLNFRQLFSVQDGGTVALDWLLASDGMLTKYLTLDKIKCCIASLNFVACLTNLILAIQILYEGID